MEKLLHCEPTVIARVAKFVTLFIKLATSHLLNSIKTLELFY